MRTVVDIVDGGGDGRLEWLELADRTTGNRERTPATGLFILIGTETRTDWLPPSSSATTTASSSPGSRSTAARWPLDRPPQPFETSIPGVFAAGDVRAGNVKRVAAAVGEGSVTVPMVHRYLQDVTRYAPP